MDNIFNSGDEDEAVDVIEFAEDDSDQIDFDEEEFADIDSWVDPDPFDLFMDSISVSPETAEYANSYYDDMIERGDGDRLNLLDILHGNIDEEDDHLDDNENNEEIAHRLKLFLGPSNYGMVKSELIFPDEFGYDLHEFAYLNVPTDNDIIDYSDTFLLEWKNQNDWTVKNNQTKCNDVLLSYISYSICIDDGLTVYFAQNGENVVEHQDNGLKAFYEKTSGLVSREFDNIKLDMMNDKDWREIYEIYENGTAKKEKLCNYVSMIKLCVEGQREGESIKDLQISIEYLSDEESKAVIRGTNEIYNQWQLWSDLL